MSREELVYQVGGYLIAGVIFLWTRVIILGSRRR